jgi:hypothetical protein
VRCRPEFRPKKSPADAVRDARRAALDRGAITPRSVPDEQEAEAAYQHALAMRQINPPLSPEPYGPGSGRSYFLDRAWTSGHPALRGVPPPPPVGSIQAAEQRLGVLRALDRPQETRDLTTSATAGGGFGASSAIPSYIADLFGVSVKTAAVLADRLETAPLPDRGMFLTLGRLTTSASVTVMSSENAAVSETDR